MQRMWQETRSAVDQGGKKRYDPAAAGAAVTSHADHFVSVLHETAEHVERRHTPRAPLPVVTAPFDAELFGHCWFEGVDFLASLYRRLCHNGLRPVTAGPHILAGANDGACPPTSQL